MNSLNIIRSVATSSNMGLLYGSGFFDSIVKNKDFLTTVIAVVSFVLSFGQLIYTIYKRRMNLSIDIQTIEHSSFEEIDDAPGIIKNKYIFFCAFINKSSAPLVITKISTYDSVGNKYPCQLGSLWIGERYYPKFDRTDVPCTERKLSAQFPICIDAAQAKYEAIVFKLPESAEIINNDHVIFEVATVNTAKSYSLVCPKTFRSSLSV